MKYYKIITDDGICIGMQNNIPNDGIEITLAEYETILSEKIANAPTEIPIEPNNDYGIPNEVYNAIIDDYTDELFEMGVL